MSGCQGCLKLESAQNVNLPIGTEKKRKGNKGSHWAEEKRRKREGEGNPMWKGDLVGINALHDWVKWWKERTPCEMCGKSSYDLCNISGEYKRDLNDFRWLCRKCHMISDGRLDSLLKHSFRAKDKCASLLTVLNQEEEK
jgi:hypothetical protein